MFLAGGEGQCRGCPTVRLRPAATAGRRRRAAGPWGGAESQTRSGPVAKGLLVDTLPLYAFDSDRVRDLHGPWEPRKLDSRKGKQVSDRPTVTVTQRAHGKALAGEGAGEGPGWWLGEGEAHGVPGDVAEGRSVPGKVYQPVGSEQPARRARRFLCYKCSHHRWFQGATVTSRHGLRGSKAMCTAGFVHLLQPPRASGPTP